ncbi:hypothetical protein DSO57_1027612 [Entomophthora muscae]|uniref:Uncharacterized protein n=1 Tax=Entomophthora muscae TaxID=34485 RepID=A0ACC2S3R6_9FUNG|nr:hypothetical protein DSO57_1027612 [Entomophthora muscae]
MASKKSHSSRAPFWFGGVACSIATVCTHPQDLLKVRLQTQYNTSQGMVGTALQVFKHEGFGALYSGLSASLLRQMTYSTVRFGTYDFLKYQLRDKEGNLSFPKLILSAILAGCIGGGVGNPIDIVNVRMQNDGQLKPQLQRNYKNVLDGLYQITRTEGFLVLFRGLRTSMCRSVVMTVSQLGSYDFIKRQLLSSSLFEENLTTHFTCSLLAGLVATTACSPLDVVKTRIMNSHQSSPRTISGGPLSSIVHICRTEGPRALLKGWVPSYLRLGPHTVITFMALEQFKSKYSDYASRQNTLTPQVPQPATLAT